MLHGERLGPAGTRRVLLGVVAQLSPWKGQDTAIETLKLLNEQLIDAHLLLVGEREDVPELVRALDVLLLPSQEEPFGRPLAVLALRQESEEGSHGIPDPWPSHSRRDCASE